MYKRQHLSGDENSRFSSTLFIITFFHSPIIVFSFLATQFGSKHYFFGYIIIFNRSMINCCWLWWFEYFCSDYFIIYLQCTSRDNIFKFVERKMLLPLCASISVSPTWRTIYLTVSEDWKVFMLCSSDLLMWISPLDEILKHKSVHSFTGPVAPRWGIILSCPSSMKFQNPHQVRELLVFPKQCKYPHCEEVYDSKMILMRWWLIFLLRVHFLDLLFQIGQVQGLRHISAYSLLAKTKNI